MTTHQEIAQVTDEELLERMINSYEGRFDEVFWNYFTEQIEPQLPDAPVMVDMGCGPGLFLRDLSARYPDATLFGYDVTQVMIDYGEKLDYQGNAPAYKIYDITAERVPLEDDSVDMLAMVALLHEIEATTERLFCLFSSHNKYTVEDWLWLLKQGGLEVVDYRELSSPHFRTFVCTPSY